MPEHVVFVPDLPRTRNGKLSEAAVRAVVNGRPVAHADQLENPACLAGIARLLPFARAPQAIGPGPGPQAQMSPKL